MPQIGCIWCVVIHKNPRSCCVFSFMPKNCKNTRWSHRWLLKKWILFWVIHRERKNQYKILSRGASKHAQKHPLTWKNTHASLDQGWLTWKRQEKTMKLGPYFTFSPWRVTDKASVTVEILQGTTLQKTGYFFWAGYFFWEILYRIFKEIWECNPPWFSIFSLKPRKMILIFL